MAVCDYCKQEMTSQVACTDPVYEFMGKGTAPRVPYGREEAPEVLALPSMAFYVRVREQETGQPYQPHNWTKDHQGNPKNCHDCGTPPGGLHHPGCDVERCPFCGWQVISCDCEDAE